MNIAPTIDKELPAISVAPSAAPEKSAPVDSNSERIQGVAMNGDTKTDRPRRSQGSQIKGNNEQEYGDNSHD
jgi:hypothetical protein